MYFNNPVSEQVHREKYRQPGETFEESKLRLAKTLADDTHHEKQLYDIFLNQRFLPGGRIQASIGTKRHVTAISCFVMPQVPDDMKGIMQIATSAALTMKMGGGVGYDFSALRPRGDIVKTTGGPSSGPVSFMEIFNAVCGTIASAGNRRGAQMGVLRIDHPDIIEFIEAKQNTHKLTNFNISVAVTDEFMEALKSDSMFQLRFNGEVYRELKASVLWDMIMQSTWDWAEPGILFIDSINKENNLKYCETIYATNPCAEQPLPGNGSCLLGSFNLVQYVKWGRVDLDALYSDVFPVVRAMDNIIDITNYPLTEQLRYHMRTRRMGLGYTGLANALEMVGLPYGSPGFLYTHENIAKTIMIAAYAASVDLAREKGSFPYFADEYLDSPFILRLPKEIQLGISRYGIRNSHLTSVAPTGTISFAANNVSSGIEPTYAERVKRTIIMESGKEERFIDDYAYAQGAKVKTTDDVTIKEHLAVLKIAQRYSDSAVSKTINCPPNTPWEDFKDVYMEAWRIGAKGVSTFNTGGRRFGVLNKEEEGAACYINPETGEKSCA